jgi:hypothetical protein
MPQGPLQIADANIIPAGAKSVKNITVPTTIKASPGTLLGFAVITAPTGAGQAVGTINDCTTPGAAAVANQVGTIPITQGSPPLDPIPLNSGITISPPTGGTTNGVVAAWFI